MGLAPPLALTGIPGLQHEDSREPRTLTAIRHNLRLTIPVTSWSSCIHLLAPPAY